MYLASVRLWATRDGVVAEVYVAPLQLKHRLRLLIIVLNYETRVLINIMVSCIMASPRTPLTVRNPHSAHGPDEIGGVRKRLPHFGECRKENPL
ncbi:hypothetical protein TNCV_1901601 [Trichonephila clavipes]|nr:hypothetical protein TNCV_1901601 [Trichonephila clavipes]